MTKGVSGSSRVAEVLLRGRVQAVDFVRKRLARRMSPRAICEALCDHCLASDTQVSQNALNTLNTMETLQPLTKKRILCSRRP